MQKLRTKYLDDLAVESIMLHSFEMGTQVASFRTTRLPEELQSKLLQKVWANMDRDGNGVIDFQELMAALLPPWPPSPHRPSPC